VARAARAVAAALAAAGCAGEPATGPVEIHWDRDSCERCDMLISDRAAAAQVRLPGERAHKFDDVGCALLWLDARQSPSAPAAEIWVAAEDGLGWQRAEAARYRARRGTPMGYGFVPARAGESGGLDLAALRELVRQAEKERSGDGR
jgi:hypothetical protein